RGGVAPGAMPPLHRYLGNPVLTGIGRLFFGSPCGDFHCGLRGFDKEVIERLDMQSSGMEFASEMVVKATLFGLAIAEVPTTLSPDGRSRAPHLRTWRDGWRHLRFLLIYSPRWLFLYPGLTILGLGLIGAIALLPGPVRVGGVGFDIHTFIVACLAILVGLQSLTFALIARKFGARSGLIPPSPHREAMLESLTLERMLLLALVVGLGGLSGVISCIVAWASTGFGPLEYAAMIRTLTLS